MFFNNLIDIDISQDRYDDENDDDDNDEENTVYKRMKQERKYGKRRGI